VKFCRSSIMPYLSVVIFVTGWALTPVFVRYMKDSYEPHSQAFIRYGSAAVALLVYSALFFPEELKAALRRWRSLFSMSLLVLAMQFAWTVAIYNTTATKAQLVTTVQAPLVIFLSFLVFREEHAVIRSWRYLLGTALCIVGVMGVFMQRSGAGVSLVVDLALVLLLFVSITWAVYAVWGRHTAKSLHPVALFTVLSLFVTAGFFLSTLLFGNYRCLVEAGTRMNGIAFISGVVCIAAAHCAFHHAQLHLGSAYCTSLQLVSPFITHVIALFFWSDEKLIFVQQLGGLLLILGCLMVIRSRALGSLLSGGSASEKAS
jgi:drug/metabolite transporter (DMT)-like permease